MFRMSLKIANLVLEGRNVLPVMTTNPHFASCQDDKSFVSKTKWLVPDRSHSSSWAPNVTHLYQQPGNTWNTLRLLNNQIFWTWKTIFWQNSLFCVLSVGEWGEGEVFHRFWNKKVDYSFPIKDHNDHHGHHHDHNGANDDHYQSRINKIKIVRARAWSSSLSLSSRLSWSLSEHEHDGDRATSSAPGQETSASSGNMYWWV